MTASGKTTPGSVFGTVVSILNGAGSLLIVGITLLICADILGRSLFGVPVAGVAEIVSLSIVAIVFLQLGHAIRSGALARTDIFLSAIRRRSRPCAALLDAVFCLMAAILFAVLLYGSWERLIDAWSSSEHVGVYGLFVVPVWPVRAVVVLGSAVAALQFGLLFRRNLLSAFKSPPAGEGGPK